jgi:hypothetical protein
MHCLDVQGNAVNARQLILLLALMCAAAACRESHLDGSSEQAFYASITSMGQEHAVADAQDLGGQLHAAEAKLGKDAVRQRMNGMTYAQAKAFLAAANEPPKAPKKD